MRTVITKILASLSLEEPPTFYEEYLQQLWKVRRPMSNDEFFDEYYRGSDVDPQVVCRARSEFESALGVDMSRLRPSDNFVLGYEGIDFCDIMYRFERVFDVSLPHSACPAELDGTFDSLVRYISKARHEAEPCDS